MFRPIACIGLLCLSTVGNATESVLEAQEAQRSAAAAYRNHDFAGFTTQLEKALALNPASVATRYNLACGYALTGNTERALELLAQVANLGIDYGMAHDPDLATLHDNPKFTDLLTRLERKLAPVSASSPFFTVDELGLIPEGIALDPATGRLFFSSMRNGGIYVIDDVGLSRFAAIEEPAGFSAIGLTVDSSRKWLWVIGTATDLAEHYDADAEIRAGVFAFDLTTGEPRGRFLADPSFDAFNDVAVAPNGDVYLSGTVPGVIRAGSDTIRAMETTPELAGTNGITVTPDGGTLFTSVYPLGLAAVDLASGAARIIGAPQSETLYGIDGLYWHEGDLVAIQNGINPWRLVRIELDAKQRQVSAIHVIEFANPDVAATTGAIVGSDIRYIGAGPAPDPAPGHVPERLVPSFGKTVIMTAPLD